MSDGLHLCAAFLNQAPGGEGRWGRPTRSMEDALGDAWLSARERWPELDLPSETFVRYLATRVGLGRDLRAALAELQLGDLYLACCCQQKGQGSAAMWAFEKYALSQVQRFLARFGKPPSFCDEVRQRLRERLFVGPNPRIAEYAGHGHLGSWLRVMTVRLALNMIRDRSDSTPGVELDRLQLCGESDPELQYIRSRYRDAFGRALRDAFLALTEEQRDLLQFYYQEGETTTTIAGRLRVTHSTIVRRLQAARADLLHRTRQLLRKRLKVSSAGLDSLIRVMDQDVPLNMARSR